MNEQSSGVYQSVSHLGTALGLLAAIFATPVLYETGKGFIGRYLLASFGHDYAPYLLLATGGIEAYVIFAVCKTLVGFALGWLMTTLVARGLTNY